MSSGLPTGEHATVDRPVYWQVSGVVQGVGFRWHVAEAARGLGVRGWVRNLADGDVEVVAAGSRAALDRLESIVRTGPPGAHVTKFTTRRAGAGADVGADATADANVAADALALPDPFVVRR